ncbi:hypothetical protein HanRHA438_Chr03g0105301 [Helianthus annuus]|nr:hypothetical protein HanRHA438_Chr03g0105301 [Helianthus annuus]
MNRNLPTGCNSSCHILEIAQVYEKTFERDDFEETDFWTDNEYEDFSVPSPTGWQAVNERCYFEGFRGTLCGIKHVHRKYYFICTILDDPISDDGCCDVTI